MCVRAAARWLLGIALAAGFAAGSGRTFAEAGRAAWPGGERPFTLRASFDEAEPDPTLASRRGERSEAEDATPVFPEPTRTGSLTTASDAPAPVAFSEAEILAGAIEVRLADPRLPLPPRLSRRDRDGLAAAYRTNGYRALWVAGGGWTDRGRALSASLARADADALDPAAYPVPALPPSGRPAAPAELAEADLKLSAAAFLYARDARGGRLDPARLSPLITPKLDLPGPEEVVARLVSPGDPGDALQTFNPPYPGYRALREKLSEVRANRPSGPVARAGSDRRASAGPVIAVLGELDSLPLPEQPAPNSARLEADIVANMERWRWLPATIAPRYVAVNVPEFQLRLIENDRTAYEARVIVGRPDTPTPIVSGLLDRAVVNPSWHIPPSILKNEILPGLARDPGYAARRGYEVTRRDGIVSVRQPPGERNALGFIKFLFPNNHAVYLHDTPNRTLFGSGRRAFSHGCVRVDQPFRLAEAMLGRDWGEARLKRMIGHGERTIALPEKLPVHLTYFTLEVGPGGFVRAHEDLYGFHRRVRVALGLGA